MAITATQFNNCALHAFKGELPDLEDNTTPTIVKCALLSIAPLGTEDVWADISANEISGTGYTAGGQAITTKALTQSSGVMTFDGDNVSWANSTLSANSCAIYEESTGYLLSYVDFGEFKESNNGKFEIQWDADGIFTVTVA